MSITTNYALRCLPRFFKENGYDARHFVLLAQEDELKRRIYNEKVLNKDLAKEFYRDQLQFINDNLMNESIIYTDTLGIDEVSNQIITMITQRT